MKKDNKIYVFAAWRRLWGDLIRAFQHLKGYYKESGGSLFSRRHMEKTSGNEYKLLKEKFHLYMQIIFYSENSHSLEQTPQETR